MSFIPSDATFEVVEKEAIADLHFSPEDVLTDPADILRRRVDADRAATLGNAHHGKLDIYFQVADGRLMRVATTVWAMHGEYLSLKSGLTLPLHAIIGFDFY
ncbi:MAG TPA: hypothetical protein VF629_06885 [Hymenobacter sp.]|jgi:hypothetical protein|uniref:hypothetical protein n=1 Tax=Hymenobacter sp. TaxID=1898978 RepID=UPI002ED8810F